MEDRMSMSNKDLYRLEILTKIQNKQLKQSKGAKLLEISPRQIKRLVRRLRQEGPKGVISRKVGKTSNNRLSQEQTQQIVEFFKQEDHRDFGPTLACEYLAEQGCSISTSSVRAVMIKNGLWTPNQIPELKIHPLRIRKDKKGELIQVDGSEHDWFEGRGPRCTLLVFIDDASSETMHLKFVKSENLFDYFKATREYIEKHGRPEAFYSDKHAVFRVNRNEAVSGTGMTQFGRAMHELDITLVCANSPQAKGRVERRNRDFQNRLIKAMRIAKISDIEAANAFLPSFLQKFNKQFAKIPKDPNNAHRALLPEHNLDRIFCVKETRKLSKNLTLSYDNVIYQILTDRPEYTLKNAEVVVLETEDNVISIEYKGTPLKAVPYHRMQARTEEVNAKELIERLNTLAKHKERYRPNGKHPWRRYQRRKVLV